MVDKNQSVKDVIAACNELMDCKILFIDKKIQNILETIAGNAEVFNLIGDCLATFNRDKEFDRIFASNGNFNIPKDEVKVIAFVFCLLADISSGKVSFDKIVGNYFVDDNGAKDYRMFMEKVIVPFRNLISEAFGVSTSITTVEAIENMEEEVFEAEEEVEEDEEEIQLGEPRFHFKDEEMLNKTFELISATAEQIFDVLYDEKIKEEIVDAKNIVNSIMIACNKKDYEMLNDLVIGLKYCLKGHKSTRFLVKELCDIITSQQYCN